MLNFYPKTNTIQLTRGDTGHLSFDFAVDVGGVTVTDYTATFHLKAKTGLRFPLLASAELKDGKTLELTHDMTKDLEAGKLVYDIEIRSGDDVMTYGPYPFILEPDVG